MSTPSPPRLPQAASAYDLLGPGGGGFVFSYLVPSLLTSPDLAGATVTMLAKDSTSVAAFSQPPPLLPVGKCKFTDLHLDEDGQTSGF